MVITKDIRSWCPICRKTVPIEYMGTEDKGDKLESKKKCLVCNTIIIDTFPVTKPVFMGKK